MKVTLESTDQISHALGTPCRIWTGTTERGTPILAFIPRIAVSVELDQKEFERELREMPPLSLAIDLRHVL